MYFVLLLALLFSAHSVQAQTYSFADILTEKHSISTLADVTTTGVATNDILAWNGSAWVVSQTTVATGTTIDALDDITDVTISSANTGDLLAWNGSAWVNQTVTDTVSTTTMVGNWPDAIVCHNGSVYRFLYARYFDGTNYDYVDPTDSAASRYRIRYNAAGAYSSHDNFSGYDCVASSWSKADLYTQGRAFNFIGNNGASTNLNEIGDVSATAPTDGQALIWSSANSRWETGDAGASASGISGAVQFSDGSGLDSDEGNLFWDDSNNRLGIGTATPNATLDVAGTVSSTGIFLTGITSTGAPVSASVSETDPQVGSLTSGKYCTSDGTAVNCTSDAPTTSRADLSIDTTDDVVFNSVEVAEAKITSSANDEGDSCTSDQNGTIFYNSTTKLFLVCTQD